MIPGVRLNKIIFSISKTVAYCRFNCPDQILSIERFRMPISVYCFILGLSVYLVASREYEVKKVVRGLKSHSKSEYFHGNVEPSVLSDGTNFGMMALSDLELPEPLHRSKRQVRRNCCWNGK